MDCGPCLLKQQGHLSPLPFPSSLSHPAELRTSFMFQTKANDAKQRALDPQLLDLLSHSVFKPLQPGLCPHHALTLLLLKSPAPRLPAPWVPFSPSATRPFNSAEQCRPHLLLEASTAIGFWSNTLDFPLAPPKSPLPSLHPPSDF